MWSKYSTRKSRRLTQSCRGEMLASQTPAHLWMVSGGVSRAEDSYKNVHVPVQNGTERKWSMFSNHLLPDLFIFFSSFTYSYEKLKRCFAGIHEQLWGFIAQCRGS